MQINAYNNLISPLVAEFKGSAQTERQHATKAADPGIELGKGLEKLLEKALVEPDGRDAVAQARQALADGTLFNQRALEAAAEKLLSEGI
ncbi:MAG: hypothetical protein GXY41_08255 [Phycisphaerae bacterium]|nr:hypothetical protein [Phycisphaerae bacterium]